MGFSDLSYRALIFLGLFSLIYSRDYVNFEVIKVGYNRYSDATENDILLEEISNVTGCEDMDEFIRVGPLHLLCPKNETSTIENIAWKYRVDFEILTPNVNEEIEKTQIGRSFNSFNINTFKHDAYLGVSSMNKWLENLAVKYKEFMRLKEIGRSHGKRVIYTVEISLSPDDPIVFIDGGVHAREWIAPATALFVIEHILKIFNGEPVAIGEFHQAEDMKKFQWHIVPNVNPDGYHYTRTEDRFWSKNRRAPETDDGCYGVNLNRNFPSGFGKGPTDPCARAYIGTHALSEPETKAIADHVIALQSKVLIMAISFHCFGQTIFTPYAYDGPPSHPLMELMHLMLDDATHHMLPNFYQFGLVKTYLRYKGDGIGGTSMDFYADRGIPFAFTWELPDMGQHGMLMPSHKIQEIGQEVMTGLSRMSAWISRNVDDINKLFKGVKKDFHLSTMTTSTTTTAPPTITQSLNGCCTMIRIESLGSATDQHAISMGLYEATKFNLNSDQRYIYKKVSNDHFMNPRYMYYLPVYGIWMVGNDLDQTFATLFHFDDPLCPEKLKTPWFYYDETWKNDDETLRVTCA